VKGFLLKGGCLVDPLQGIHGIRDVLVKGETIAAVGTALETAGAAGLALALPGGRVRVLDVSGLAVLPGCIDLHVHLREPGQEEKETIASGCAAAAAGGITALACMANTDPVVDSAREIRYILDKVRSLKAAPRVYPVGALTRGLKGEELADLKGMAQAGAAAFSDDGKSVVSAALMAQGMEAARALGMKVFSHCEEPTLSGGFLNQGEVSRRLGLPGSPGTAEDLMVARDLLLCAHTGCSLHIQHVSTARAAEMIAWAKDKGLPVTAEATPHHLLLTEEAVAVWGANAKMSPPLRTAADRQAVVRALKEGVIDCIATDHAPHTREEKERGLAAAPFGVAGLETALPALLTGLVEPGILTLAELVERFSLAPARILGVPGGTLAPGSPADLTLVDLRESRPVRRANFCSLGKNTPFEGETLRGWPVMTVLQGTPVPLTAGARGKELARCLNN
jgi:dihydroorotase